MAKKQDSKTFLENASARESNRRVLCFVNKTEKFSVSADRYRAHFVLTDLPEYELGLNHTKYSAKKGMTLDGRYPDMEYIKNSRAKTSKTVTLDKDTIAELLQAIKIAMVFAKDSANSVLFSFADGKIAVTGKSAERGDAVTIVEIKGQHANVEILANGHYMTDALKGFQHDSVTIYLKEQKPIHFESLERYAIVMPFSR